MQQPSSTPSAPSGPAAPTATELVTRPDPGVARGRWEAPVWLFWVMLAVVLLATTAYVLRRMGILRIGARNTGSSPPPSTRMRRP